MTAAIPQSDEALTETPLEGPANAGFLARRARRCMRCAAAVSALALAALGCGSGEPAATVADIDTDGSPETTAPGAGADGEPDERTTTTDQVETDDDTDGEPQTLAEYLGIPWLSFDSSDQMQIAKRQQQQVQELIASCMAQEGFDYIPVVQPVPDDVFGHPDDVEYARDKGFGVTTSFGDTSAFMPQSDWTDPNEEIVQALSESEREAYYQTLHGYGQGFDSASSSSDSDGEGDASSTFLEPDISKSCSGKAYEAVYAWEKTDEIFELIDLESMNERMQADPRVQAWMGDWSDCMAERGYDYEDPEVMYEFVWEDFSKRLEEITGGEGFFGPMAGVVGEAGSAIDDGDGSFAAVSPETFADDYEKAYREMLERIDQDALAALQAEERALAVANAECSGGLMDLVAEVSREHEARFIEENRAVLEQFRADSGR